MRRPGDQRCAAAGRGRNSGQAIAAAELAARGLSLRLAGRRRGPLEDLARALAAAGAKADVCAIDVGDTVSLAEATLSPGSSCP
jgi:short-subunit dehydrogenase